MNDEKRRALELAARHVCPDRVRTFGAIGVDLVIGRREGYRIWDLDGRELLDLHLNGGVFNLGHRHPSSWPRCGTPSIRPTSATITSSLARAELPKPWYARCRAISPRRVRAQRGEAIDVAIKSARHATQRRTIVSIRKGYHGHMGLALAAGDTASRMFLSEGPPGDFLQVPSTTSTRWRRRSDATRWRPSSSRRFRRRTAFRCRRRDTSRG
jgi:acetylornithine/succinyldiaminopimelate/putrescine aminotransferase